MLSGTADRAHELKAEGALQAAADPDTPVTADQAEQVALHQAKAAGAAAFEFNPDADPEEKAAQLKAVGGARGAETRRCWLT